MKLIVGLGNPGKKYEKTRHNVGFWAIDGLGAQWNMPIEKEKWKAFVGEGFIDGEKVILMKPLTYMNLSGEAVSAAINFLKIDIQDFIVIYDDLDLPLGSIKLRKKGSSGGHNGVKSIIHHLGTDEFKRIKIGIGKSSGHFDVKDYVLSLFDKEENEAMNAAVETAMEATKAWIRTNFETAMNTFNQKSV